MHGVLTNFINILLVKAAAVEKHIDHLRTTPNINIRLKWTKGCCLLSTVNRQVQEVVALGIDREFDVLFFEPTQVDE